MANSMEKIFASAGDQTAAAEPTLAEAQAAIEKKYGRPMAEILAQRQASLALLARIVGSDFGMKVKFGEPGGGSFFTPEQKDAPRGDWNSIVLDPLILGEFEGCDEFVAAHEGAHRAITRTLVQAGIMQEKERDSRAEQIGWNYIHNALEDPAVNNWAGNLYERIGDILKDNYEQTFTKENAVMSTPQVQQMIRMLGYVPNFVRYGSELMRYWHKQSFSAQLPEVVAKALKITTGTAETFWQQIPYSYPTEQDVLKKSKLRWQVFEKGIWPFVQEMIKEDLLDEKLKQFIKDQLQKAMEQGEEGQPGQPGQPGQHGGQPGQSRSLEDLMNEFGFSEQEKQEMRQKMREAMERKKQQMQDLKDKLAKGEISREEFDQAMKQLQDSLPLDTKSLSESAKKKLQEQFDGQSAADKRQLEDKAKAELEKAEDQANKSIQGKIGPVEESHDEQHKRQIREAQEAARQAFKKQQEQAERDAEEQALKKWQDEQAAKRNDWEQAFSQYAEPISRLYDLVEEFFKKKRHPRWRHGYPSGQQLNLGMAMQFEKDPRTYTVLWNRKTIPEKFDYRFSLLNDQSGSMRDGQKTENDLAAKVIVTEVLTNLGIPCEILGYTDYEGCIKEYKKFDEDLNEKRETLQSRLSKIVSDGGGGTPTHEATSLASARLSLQRENNRNHAHFLIVITDGESTDCNLDQLRELNKTLSEDNQQIIIGMGIGQGINEESLAQAYGQGRYVHSPNPQEFPAKMAALLEAIFMQSQHINK